MEADRIKNILANEPAIFEIVDSPRAKSATTWYEFHRYGYVAVWIHQDIIEYEARRQGIDPDLVKAIMYFENVRGASYGQPAERLGELAPDWLQSKPLAESILPMNIRPQTWGGLIGDNESFGDPLVNIRAGVTVIRRIIERLSDPTVAKVGSIYGFTGYENVSDNGARIADFYQTRAWERKPGNLSPRTQRALHERRESLKRRIVPD